MGTVSRMVNMARGAVWVRRPALVLPVETGLCQLPLISRCSNCCVRYVILKVEGPTRLVVNFYADCNWTPSPADGPNTNCSQAHQLVHSQELRRAPGLWTDQHAPPAGPRQPSNSSQKH